MSNELKKALENLVKTWAKFPLKSDECANATVVVIRQFKLCEPEAFTAAFMTGLK